MIAFRRLSAGSVEAVERSGGQCPVELGAVRGHLRLQSVEHALRKSAGVRLRLHHDRRDGADQHRLGDAALTVPGDVVHDFPAAGGVSDVDGVVKIEMSGHRGEIVGVVVHVVTVAGLGRPAVSPAVMGDDPVAVLEEEQHLGVPVVGGQRPAVAEDDRLARSPVLVEDLRAVCRGDRAHAFLLRGRGVSPSWSGSITAVGRVC